MDLLFTGVTPELVATIFPGVQLSNVVRHLPDVLNALRAKRCDRVMLLMALATIRAEVAAFVPMDEGQSHFNTDPGGVPFGRYDNRKDLGNQGNPDGDRFKGRGYVQLTGRANYLKFGVELGLPLIAKPEMAGDPTIAGMLLVRFLLDKETAIRGALARLDYALARKLVNGGSNGLDHFTSAYKTGETVLPA